MIYYTLPFREIWQSNQGKIIWKNAAPYNRKIGIIFW